MGAGLQGETYFTVYQYCIKIYPVLRFTLAAPPKRYSDTEQEVDLSTTVTLKRVLHYHYLKNNINNIFLCATKFRIRENIIFETGIFDYNPTPAELILHCLMNRK